MKLIKYLGFLLPFCFYSCASEVDIVDPTIMVEGSGVEYYAYDSLDIHVIQSAEIDGNKIAPDYFDWTITTASGAVIINQRNNSDRLKWFPTEKGRYVISVKIGYDGNKSVTKIKDFVVRESPNSLLKKISGKWRGAGETSSATFTVDYFNIHPNGNFWSSASNWSSPIYSHAGVFYMDSNVNNGGVSSIVINAVDDFGNVDGHVVLRYSPNGYPIQMCLKYLKTNATNDSLYLAVDQDHSCKQYPWYVRHKLVRVP